MDQRITAMDQRIINLYDSFTHGGVNRRDFLEQLAGLTKFVAASARRRR